MHGAAPVEFGLGLIGLGRKWGFQPRPLPSPDQAFALLDAAVALGVAVFDTAPAYGSSEIIAGQFFRGLSHGLRQGLVVATKCGEHWDEEQGVAFTDHSYDALARSIDRSLKRLGEVDLLQLHKATVAVLHSPEVWRALDHARSCGIGRLGASVSDLAAGKLACELDAIAVVQMPYNVRSRSLEEIFSRSRERGKHVWTNRPFAMGAMIHEDRLEPEAAYRFVLAQYFRGVVLTGTADIGHLKQNLAAFALAAKDEPDRPEVKCRQLN